MSGRMFHFGEYEGVEIEQVVEIDPSYILWASTNEKGHEIPNHVIMRARQLLDEPVDDNEWSDEDEVQYLRFGDKMYEWE